jgi:hypothetical protein
MALFRHYAQTMILLTAIHLDLMNHHNGLINTSLRRTDDGMGLTVLALTDIAAGEQIWNTVSTFTVIFHVSLSRNSFLNVNSLVCTFWLGKLH